MIAASPMNSPLSASPTGGAGGRLLDSSPPVPPSQRRSSNVLFTPPMEENGGLGDVAADPMVKDMMATKAIDQALQMISINHPELVQPLAILQQQFRQLMAQSMAMAAQGQGMNGMAGPGMMPPQPQAMGGENPGQQMGPRI